MVVGAQRNKVLYGLGRKRAALHRYTWIRWAVGVTATVGVALLPATDTLRIDLWSGSAWWLGEKVGLVRGAKAFAFPFLAINVAILFLSRFLGRWLCGFVCPVGNLNRLDEWLRWHFRKGLRGTAVAGTFLSCAALAAVTFAFWVDWRVFVDGSPAAVVAASAFLLGTTLVLLLVVHGLGMRFCRDYCPSGVYFALLGPQSSTGVDFQHPENCTDCHACEHVCPVDLKPREMADVPHRGGTGFYPDGLTDYANCLRCGDCVVVCEQTTSDQPEETPLRLGWIEAARPAEDGS